MNINKSSSIIELENNKLNSVFNKDRLVKILLGAIIFLGGGFTKQRVFCRAASLLMGYFSTQDWLCIFSLVVISSFTPLANIWRFKKVGMIVYYGLSMISIHLSSIFVKKLPNRTFTNILSKTAAMSLVDKYISNLLFHNICGIPMYHLEDNFWVLAISVILVSTMNYIAKSIKSIYHIDSTNN